MSWGDYTAKIKSYDYLNQSQVGFIDTGDRAKTYIFSDKGPGTLGFIGTSAVKSVLQRIAKTNDGNTNWGEANNGDGESSKRIELFDEDKNVSDDFVALVKEALEGDEGLTLVDTGRSKGKDFVSIEVEGSRSTDLLKFQGGFVTQALAELASDNPCDIADALGDRHIDNGDGRVQLGVYTFELGKDEKKYWSHDKNLSDDVVALFDKVNNQFHDEDAVALTVAALEEKFGLADYDGLEFLGGTADCIAIDLQTDKGPVDTIILRGSEIADTIAGFNPETKSGWDPKDGRSATIVFDTDTETQLYVGGGGSTQGKIWYDAAGTETQAQFGNYVKLDEVDDMIGLILQYDGEAGVNIIAGGEAGDDFLTATFSGAGATDTIIFTGSAAEDAIDDHYGIA
ncbi:hypothetical protein CLV78_10147 [Aliiruegeria haliotis]|uniref:Uncharacterized protein n=1 Tax=Aliiruegeria haliotis TaxID=1280846 RepID=A0A2T0RXN9_9RHOB|nr:hypothetical protein [Aliiruegeria haliotis]PRY25956.1 hypothetical protein CLV78_10147 [Aliiruegeria haliotis]